MNVLHLTQGLESGGRREVIANLCRAIRGRGAWCEVGVLREAGPPSDAWSNVHVFGHPGKLELRPVHRLAEFCRQENIDVVHTHDAASQFVAARMRLHTRRAPRILMTFHRSLPIESRTWRDRMRNRLACWATDGVVAISRERREHYTRVNRIPSKKVVCIPNGIDAERFARRDEDRESRRRELGCGEQEIVCGTVGHFREEKGVGVVLRAFRNVARQRTEGPPVRLVVLGDGTNEDRRGLESLAAECAAEVTFLGFRDDVDRWYSAFDVLLHAPRSEAFGLVVAEAMAAGLPVVATRVGGIPEVVEDEETGLLVDSENHEALASAALRLIADGDLRREFGIRGRERVTQEFTIAKQAERYLALYETICRGESISTLDGHRRK